jgi:hypothetical protein
LLELLVRHVPGLVAVSGSTDVEDLVVLGWTGCNWCSGCSDSGLRKTDN